MFECSEEIKFKYQIGDFYKYLTQLKDKLEKEHDDIKPCDFQSTLAHTATYSKYRHQCELVREIKNQLTKTFFGYTI